MKNLLSFLKVTAQGGFLVLLPILLFILLMAEMIQLVEGLATPIADLFPADTFDDPENPLILAVFLIAGASFLIGIAMRSEAANRLGNWIEKKTIERLPIYRFVKSLVSGLIGAEKAANFKPALLDAGSGHKQIVYIVEDVGNDHFSVLCPHAPTGFAGPVMIVPENHIAPLDASLGDVNLVMNHMGLGAGELLKSKEPIDIK